MNISCKLSNNSPEHQQNGIFFRLFALELLNCKGAARRKWQAVELLKKLSNSLNYC